MANTIVLFGEADSNAVYKIGKIGYDSGAEATYDPGTTPFTGSLITERMSPTGEGGLARFRRVSLRALKAGAWTVTFTVWVDDVQTQVYDLTNVEQGAATFPLVAQTITISNDTDDTGEGEAVIEADIDAHGTFIQVQVELISTDIKGYFMPESIEVHLQAIRQTKSRATAETS